ncbi:MAG: signal recognition particle-docking protein FtsY [Desulfobacteraceae bacterium]|nr:signal recognition particle-docking protein FtsY [Desulfobacteraceae bacterium]
MKWFKKKKDNKNKEIQTEYEVTETAEVSDLKVEPVEEDTISREPEKEMPDESRDHTPESESGKGFVKRLRKGLSKTREFLQTDIDELFSVKRKVDDELLEELEERLITSDIGVSTTMELMERISKKSSKIKDAGQLRETLKQEILSFVNTQPTVPVKIGNPHIIMIVGVNGVGKTTTIAKIAAKFEAEGKKVLIAAADTFRAAAVEQLAIWAERVGADIVKHRENADPAAVAFDGVEAAVARGKDIVLVDTAGRLHTKVNLMEELKKIKRAVSKNIYDAPHEVLLVLDATTGQNALSQVKMFNDAIGVTGIALAKLDGTAKGGIVVSICNEFQIPLKYIGIGEQIEDLQDFNPTEFVNALF